MKNRTGTRLVWLMCGMLLALPVAHAKKSQDEDGETPKNEPSKSERSAPIRGGYLEKDKARGSSKNERQGSDDSRSAPQPRDPTNYEQRGNERGYTPPQYPPTRDNAYPRNDNTSQRRSDERGYPSAPTYNNNGYDERSDERNSTPAPRYAPRGMNLSEAVSQAERSTGGRVLSAEPIDDNGRPSYRVKVLTGDGRVKILYLDSE